MLGATAGLLLLDRIADEVLEQPIAPNLVATFLP